MNFQVGVKALIKNSNGQYLFIQRKDGLADGSGIRWDIPGGRIEPQETLAAAIKREVKEETGLDILKEPKLLAAQDIFIQAKKLHIVRLTYSVPTKGKIRLSSEHQAYKYVSIGGAQILNIDKYLRKTLEDL